MSSGPAANEIWSDARWLAQAVDPGAELARLVEMTPEAYREASFLDDRMFQQPRNSHLLGWKAVVEAMPPAARTDARWIFHIGHVGSTLVARLLGELDGVLSVREPRALRDLTFFPREVRTRYIPVVRALLSRTFAPGEFALVKATSMVSEIAGELVPAGGRALFMYADPGAYIAGILAGENSRKELAGMAETRAKRLAGRGLHFDPPRHESDLAASAWACEITALESAANAMQDLHVIWADFDLMLDDMEAALADAVRLFGFTGSNERFREIVSGPLMRRYSKALEYEYSPSLRRELLAETSGHFRRDIDGALAMLSRAADKSPLLGRALERSAREG